MKSNLSLQRVAALVGLVCVAATLRAESFYSIGKGQSFVQTSTAAPVADPLSPFDFHIEATTAVTLTLPSGATVSVPFVSGDDAYELATSFATKTSLDAAYPNGLYRLTGTGIPTLNFNLSNDLYSSITPQVVGGTWNAGGLLVINPSQSTTINFNTFSDYGTLGVASHMGFNVDSLTSGGGQPDIEQEIATQPIFGLTASATPFTSYVIPAGRLVSGQPYRAELQFDTIAAIDSTTFPDGGTVALFGRRLSFYIAAQNTGTSTAAPVITTQPTNQVGPLGSSVIFSASFSVAGLSQNSNSIASEWTFNGTRISFSSAKYTFGFNSNNTQTLTVNNLTAADVGSYTFTVITAGGVVTSPAVTYTIGAAPAPSFTQQPASVAVAPGGSAQFTASASGALTYQWYRNGTIMNGAVGPTLPLSGNNLISASYTVVATGSGGSTTSKPAILSVATVAKVDGAASEIASNILHPTGNIYDQVLLTGQSATIKAETGKVTRMSFIDLNDDIVQVEFTGAGRLFLSLENATGPAAPVKYNQAVNYMRGQASIVVSGADATTNVSVFSVGRGNAVNQALFKDDVTYDSHADIAYLAISSLSGQFGGARTANASYFSTKGMIGFYAPNVAFEGPVFVGDIDAFDNASPVFAIGSSTDVRVTGGDLFQTNGRAVAVNGITQLKFTAGTNSKGELEAAQANRGRLEQDGVDVTSTIVVNPGP